MTELWKAPQVYDKTIFSSINKLMLDLVHNYQTKLPVLHNSATLMCFSDYSGEEQESNYFVYSFLIISGNNLIEWDNRRKLIRNRIIADGRRVSYKNYRDKLSQNFIEEYLKIADDLNGYLITVSISKEISSLFENDVAINLSNPDFSKYSVWTKDTLEKTFRVMHLLSFFVAGFSRSYQNLIWITDDDKIVPNRDRLKHLTELFGYVATGYLNHTLGHLKVGTTQSDDGTRLIEDLCSIPDLAAGAYSDQLKNPEADFADENGKIFWMYVPHFQKKTNYLTWWLTTSSNNLCKLCFRIEKKENSNNVSFYHFYNRE